MRGTGRLKGILAVALAAVFVVSSLDTAWTVRTSSLRSTVDPSLRAGEVAIVHTMSGLAGALSLKLARLGAVDIQTEDAADTVIARLTTVALAAIASDPSVTAATRDIAVIALDGGKGTGFERDNANDKDKDDKDKDDNDNYQKDNEQRVPGRTSSNTGGSNKGPSASVKAIHGPQAWTQTTGDGVTVAVMDTGIADHPDLPRGKVRARIDFVKDGATSQDPAGHGTFIAGVIAANGATQGVAPDARLVSLRVLDANGRGSLSSVVGAFNWVLKNQERFDIKVLSLSWGAPQATTYHTSILSALVESAWFSGVTVVAASGNDGPAAGSIKSPASDPFVVAAGSFNDRGTTDASDDVLSSFTGRGPTLDGFAKPDTLAPGEHVASLRVNGVTYLGVDGAPIGSPSDQYIHMTGTSASAAFVSGVAALVASAHTRYTPTQIKGAIVASGRPISGSAAAAVDAPNALTRTPAQVNVRLKPSRLLLQILSKSHLLRVHGVTWDGVTWEDGVSWDGVTWEDGVTSGDSLTWESISWEAVSWKTVSWETVTWDGVTWEDAMSEE